MAAGGEFFVGEVGVVYISLALVTLGGRGLGEVRADVAQFVADGYTMSAAGVDGVGSLEGHNHGGLCFAEPVLLSAHPDCYSGKFYLCVVSCYSGVHFYAAWAGLGLMLVGLSSKMNMDILVLAVTSVTWIWILFSPLLISVSKRRGVDNSGLVGICILIVFLVLGLSKMNQKGLASVSLMERRSLSSLDPCGIFSVVVMTMTISRWSWERALVKRGAGFLFVFLVTSWKEVWHLWLWLWLMGWRWCQSCFVALCGSLW